MCCSRKAYFCFCVRSFRSVVYVRTYVGVLKGLWIRAFVSVFVRSFSLAGLVFFILVLVGKFEGGVFLRI